MRDLEWLEVFCAGFGAKYVRVDEFAVFSVNSIIDLLQNSISIEIYSGIARFSLRYSTAFLSKFDNCCCYSVIINMSVCV